MNKSLPEKEKLLSMLTEVYDQLEELELVLEASFSDLRHSLNYDELNKIITTELRLSNIEKELDKINQDDTGKNSTPVTRSLKLEMGF